jgi:hypothetical protein
MTDVLPQTTLASAALSSEPCAACATPLADDQRYCLECGARRGAARLDVLAAARGRSRHPRTLIHADQPPFVRKATPLGGPRIAATLCMAMLAGGIALGVAAGPQAASTLAAGGRRVIAVVQFAPPPTVTVAAEPTPVTTPDEVGTPEPAAAADPVAAPVPVAADPVVAAGSTTTDDTPAVDPADTPETGVVSALPPVKHVWVISLTGQRYEETWGPAAVEPAFAELRKQGTLLARSFSVAHGTVPGGVALLSGQGPNAATQAGCTTASPLDPGTIDAEDPLAQAMGTGCLYPPKVDTLPDQLTGAGLTWKAYVESIASPDPDGQQTCRHPDEGQPDPFTGVRPGDPYLTARDPFVFFKTIVSDPACGSNVVGTDRLTPDLTAPDGIPNVSFIVPDACHDGRSTACAEGAPAGLAAAGPWVKGVVDQIQATAAYKDAGLIVITGDEGPSDGLLTDSRGCRCALDPWPNSGDAPADPTPASATKPAPRGGGRVGTLLLSPFVTQGATVLQEYDQISLLKSLEDLFGLAHLGAANDDAHKPLGSPVYARYTPPSR